MPDKPWLAEDLTAKQRIDLIKDHYRAERDAWYKGGPYPQSRTDAIVEMIEFLEKAAETRGHDRGYQQCLLDYP